MNCEVYACLIDFKKAFDRVKQNKLFQILKDSGIDDKDLRLIRNLHLQQTATVRVDNLNTQKVNLKREVRQGCILSLTLFNAYSDMLFREALNGIEEGVINNIRFADDTVL